jgi:acyl carrier protein
MEDVLRRIESLPADRRRQLAHALGEQIDRETNAGPADQALSVYYVARNGLTVDTLRAFLRGRLPGHMLPAEFTPVETLPKTVSGKVDRQALRRLPRAAATPRSAAPAANELERQMAEIWRQVLSVPHVQRDDNFFELGGHSLLATQVVMEIERRFGAAVPLAAMFGHPTLAALCSHVATIAPQAGPPASAVADEGSPGHVPLSPAQRSLWYASHMGDGLEYKIVKGLRLDGALNVPALRQALAAILDRHETLRTSFGYVAGKLGQKIAPADPEPIALVDLSHLAPAQAAAAFDRLDAGIRHRPFDLENGPLVRVTLVRFSPLRAHLVFDVHHIVVDGQSFVLLVNELNRVVHQFARGRPNDLPSLTLQYRHVAARERRRYDDAALDRQRQYWLERLADLPWLEFIEPRLGHGNAGEDGELAFTFERRVGDGILAACRQLQTTPFIWLAAVYHVLLQMHSGASDIAIGADVSNRDSIESAQLIGFFVNQVVLRVDAHGAATFRQLAHRVRDAVEGAFANKQLPYDSLLRELKSRQPGQARRPPFRAMFSFHHQSPDIAFDGVRASFLEAAARRAKYDLLLNLEEGPDGLQGSFEYRGSVFDRPAIERFAEHFTMLCAQAAANLDVPLDALREAPRAAAEGRKRQEAEVDRATRQRDLREFLVARRAR